MELTLNVKDLCYKYRDKPVLDGATVEIRPGEILGILGVNGSGKTTLLKNLNRNLSPESGAVYLDGSDLQEMTKKDIAKTIAAVPQGNEIRFAFTVEEMVAMGRIPFMRQFEGESSEDLKIIEQAMRDTGLWEMKDRLINEMSGGERQKVIIARALAQTPKYLLMDEPTNHLDISAQFDVLDLVSGLARKNGISVVLVSHNLPMAARYCDRVALVKDHTIICTGTPEEILTPENMREVFSVDGELIVNPKNGLRTVILNGSVKKHE